MPVALALRDLRVRSLDIDFNELTWRVAETSEDIFDYNFQVLRSESPSGPFDILTPDAFQDRYRVIDNTIKTGHRWRQYFYKLRIKHIPSGEYEDSPPVSKDPDPDIYALEIRRQEQMLFQEHAGRRCWILPVRTFGQRCSCWNVKLKQRTRSGCRTCWDTSWLRGYLHPIEQWIQIDPSPKTKQNTNLGPQQQSNTTMRMAFYPPLKPDDLVIEAENRRWRVITVTQTEKGRAALHQEVQLHEIPSNDIEYAIPLNLTADLHDLWLSPARNFTNPQNLEAFFDAEMPGIFDLYLRRKP